MLYEVLRDDMGLYAYVGNDPLNKNDPDGKIAKALVSLIKVAAKGGDAYSTVSGLVENGRVIASPTASLGQKLLAGADIALDLATGINSKDIRAASEAAKEAGIVANGIRGRASEARVLNELGLAKNTTAVSTAEGRSIPDALTRSLSVEVKDAANVSLTRQLRITSYNVCYTKYYGFE